MSKMTTICFIFALLSSNLGWAGEKYIVSGEVPYSGKANIYVCMFNQETWPNFKRELPPSEFMQIVKANEAGKAPFTFKEVPEGEYIIQVFADENNNGKMDYDSWGYKIEPASMYKPPPDGIHTNWYDQKFMVDKNITGLVIKLHN